MSGTLVQPPDDQNRVNDPKAGDPSGAHSRTVTATRAGRRQIGYLALGALVLVVGIGSVWLNPGAAARWLGSPWPRAPFLATWIVDVSALVFVGLLVWLGLSAFDPLLPLQRKRPSDPGDAPAGDTPTTGGGGPTTGGDDSSGGGDDGAGRGGGSAGGGWHFVERVVTFVIPLAAVTEFLTYCFNLGWAQQFGIPIWLVSAAAPQLATVIAGVAVVAVFVALAIAASDRQPNFDFKTLELTVREQPFVVAAVIAVLSIDFWAQGHGLAASQRSWSMLNAQCSIVATFGDTIIAADVSEASELSKGSRRMAPDFTVYRATGVPQFWQGLDRTLLAVPPDSETHTPIRGRFECPEPSSTASKTTQQTADKSSKRGKAAHS